MRKAFKLKYTNGKVADPTAFPFKESQPGDSPTKFSWGKTLDATKGVLGGLGIGEGSQEDQRLADIASRAAPGGVDGGNANVNNRNQIIKQNALDEPIAPASR